METKAQKFITPKPHYLKSTLIRQLASLPLWSAGTSSFIFVNFNSLILQEIWILVKVSFTFYKHQQKLMSQDLQFLTSCTPSGMQPVGTLKSNHYFAYKIIRVSRQPTHTSIRHWTNISLILLLFHCSLTSVVWLVNYAKLPCTIPEYKTLKGARKSLIRFSTGKIVGVKLRER